MKRASVNCLVLALLAAPAYVQDFNLDLQSFNSPHGVPTVAYGGPADRPGVWQRINSNVTAGMIDIDGNATSASLEILAQLGYFWDGDVVGTSGDDEALLDDTHQAAPQGTYSFTGLEPGHYRVWTVAVEVLFASSAWAVRGVGSAQGTYDVRGLWAGDYHVQRNFLIHDYFVTDGSLQVVADAKHPFVQNSQISGFQIVRVDDPGAPYCYGVATYPNDHRCPCNNDASEPTGCLGSHGVGARLAGAGSASIAADDLMLIGQDLVPGQGALLLVGTTPRSLGFGMHHGDGLLCVGGTVRMLNPGALSARDGALWGPGLNSMGAWGVGQTRYFQIRYRDAAGPCGLGFNLSNGYEVTFTP